MSEQKYSAGTGGFVVVPFSLLSTSLNALANAGVATGTEHGASGVFDQSNTGGYLWGVVSLYAGGAFTPVAPNILGGWFARKADGAAFERVVSGVGLERPYDWTIRVHISAYSAGQIAASALCRVPSEPWMPVLHNRAGVSLPATGNLLKLGLFALASV